MAVQSAATKRRKNPPTFSHLPRDRAQKVKKSWVEKKKLQVRWRAQKRKEGLELLHSGKSSLDEPRDEIDRTRKRKVSGDDERASESGASSSRCVADMYDRDGPAIDEENGSERPPLRRKKALATVPRVDEQLSSKQPARSKGKQPARSLSKEGEKPKSKLPEDDNDQPSLRELSRRAYAPSSLHSFKADPLHRRKDRVISPHPKERKSSKVIGARIVVPSSQARSDQGRGGRNSHTNPGRQERQRRGQPDMKLRMEAMLERIKRDYS